MPAKYVRLADALRAEMMHGDIFPGDRLPAEQALAAQYHVSRQTVRQALRQLAEEGRIVTRKGSGTRVSAQSGGEGRRIAIIPTYIDDYIFPAVLQDMQAVLAAQGYAPILYATQNQTAAERSVLLQLLAHPPCGALIEGVKTALPNPNLDLYEKLRRAHVPLVFFHGSSLPDAVCIADDNVGGGYLLTQHLIGLGHQHIAGIFKSDDSQGPARYSGYSAALRDAGLTFSDSCILWYTTEDRADLLDSGNTGALHNFILHRMAGCTAVVCYNDEIAWQLGRLLAAQGIRVPEDVSLASFDNSYFSDVAPVPITTLGHDGHLLGRTAAQALLDQLSGKKNESRIIRWSLIRKESTAPRKDTL